MTNLTQVSLESGFRDAMAHLAAPVTVVTVMAGERPHGTTVSAVVSLSMQPCLISVALAKSSDCLGYIAESNSFGVNVLSSHQHAMARQLAGKGAAKFDGIDWQESAGLPRLAGTAIWVACTALEFVDGGDHEIIVGQVLEVDTSPGAAPLTYHRRQFGTHVPSDIA
ncbi:flavin reductase family protein [Nocardia jiangxiensis]|uniref:Flavin reductase family protein n=1 Tax=Nocardia jiangxiensis TaxID=282685 RepID=A0ABW6S8N5_9NOCA|nr:flavin reductase family protein [Nocardia jiangxiensis]